jgi:HTH-type transcriptional regulator / antitoxin HigA
MATIFPIENDDDLARALARVDQIWPKKETQSFGNELKVLGVLISEYEARHHPVPPPTPVEAIRFRLDQLGMNQSRFAEALNVPRSRASEILRGKRPMTIDIVRRVNRVLSIDANVLIKEHGVSTLDDSATT